MHQWTKNLVVFAGLIFSEHLLKPPFFIRAAVGAALFCAISSGVYIVNDLMDRDRDRLHPKKRLRPIASGRLSLPVAAITAVVLLAGGVTAALLLGGKFGLAAALYAVLNLAYSLGLKNIVVLDVMLLASGFVLRAVAGVKVLTPLDPTIQISPWLLVCTLFLALFLAIAKRRAELRSLATGAASHRKSLSEYSEPLLDQMMSIVTSGAVLSYSIYTVAPDTIRKFGTTRLVYTIPFVLFGIFRYLYLMTQKDGGGNPSEHLLTDRPLLGAVAAWGLAVLLILYGAHARI
jgi:4-hydroxybenzoate polyprenyltransferase